MYKHFNFAFLINLDMCLISIILEHSILINHNNGLKDT